MEPVFPVDKMTLADPSKFFRNLGPLIFSLFYFLPIIGQWSEIGWQNLLAQLLIYIGFVALYCAGLHTPGTKVTPIIILMLLLTSCGTLVTSGTSTLFGYIAPLCGFNYRRPYNFLMLGVLFLFIFFSSEFLITTEPFYFWAPSALIAVGLFSFGLMEHRERVHRLLHQKNQQKLEQLAAIAERERIARDLHDTLGHSLSSIALKAELASKLCHAGLQEKASDESQQVATLARALLSDVREAVSGLKQIGLYAQLNLLEQRLKEAQFNVVQQVESVTMGAEQESALCFIAKELVTNILRHSNAREVNLKLTQQNTVQLCISDDGKVESFTHGNGLSGLIERAQQAGAIVDINIEQGFTVKVEFSGAVA
ncbi:sensor histidine kinase [Pseudoalteromonas sp. MMG005]|uniref:sensor histidine kinase n=1 Tax=Pseudoalteromonas sp. MMG005 TaxID=2822682 RepID=UPI001B3A1EED|nr:sensor histidine kinase [Pseudoalteromonas sp. MMG005]MBQ4846529.1 sensor histidine kinase [Pseudoalteromonas sp. MMG005]